MLFFVKLKMGFLQNVHIYSKKKKYKAQNSKIYFLQFLSVFDKFVNCNIRFQRIKNSKTQIFFFCFAVKMHRLAYSWTKTLRLVSLEDKKKASRDGTENESATQASSRVLRWEDSHWET
uniref:Uncharacterized protein n=1 Tax=Opuntia streptacantha TaxID=393608 RepID=A0A7C9F6Y0_OPUST